MDSLDTLFRHHAWATLRLLDHCAGLTAEQRAATVPGTYGPIEGTLVHLVAADQRYLRRLDGQEAAIPISERESPPVPADMRAAFEQQIARWEAIVAREPELDVTIPAQRTDPDIPHGERLMILQALHHGNDHRTHVCTILGALGLDAPELDGWNYWHEQVQKLG